MRSLKTLTWHMSRMNLPKLPKTMTKTKSTYPHAPTEFVRSMLETWNTKTAYVTRRHLETEELSRFDRRVCGCKSESRSLCYRGRLHQQYCSTGFDASAISARQYAKRTLRTDSHIRGHRVVGPRQQIPQDIPGASLSRAG
jgi:hypothetical protein